jgi:uncharacterized protein (DUF488 family)
MKFFTIGVYHSSQEEFIRKLLSNSIDYLIDIRQRRGVRGSKYKFANLNSLRHLLSNNGIRYLHVPELAPTAEIRLIQKKNDALRHEKKSTRTALSECFIEEYRCRILYDFPFTQFLNHLHLENVKNAVLFCVEQNPEACHRLLVAEKLEQITGTAVIHL